MRSLRSISTRRWTTGRRRSAIWASAICRCLTCSKGCCQTAGGLPRSCTAAAGLWRTTTRISGGTRHRRICGFPAASGWWEARGSARTYGCTTSIRVTWSFCAGCFRSCERRHSFFWIFASGMRSMGRLICVRARACRPKIRLSCQAGSRGQIRSAWRWTIRSCGICSANATARRRFSECPTSSTDRSSKPADSWFPRA